VRAASPGAIAFFIVLAVAVSAAASYSLWALSGLPGYTTGDIYLGGALTYTFYPVSLPDTQGYSYRVYLINDKPYRTKADIVAIFTDGSTATNCTTAAGGVVSTTGIEVPPKTSVEVTCTYPKQVLSIQVYEYGQMVQRTSGVGYVGTAPGSGADGLYGPLAALFSPASPNANLYTFTFTIHFRRVSDSEQVAVVERDPRTKTLEAYDAYTQGWTNAYGAFQGCYDPAWWVGKEQWLRRCFYDTSYGNAYNMWRWNPSGPWQCGPYESGMFYRITKCSANVTVNKILQEEVQRCENWGWRTICFPTGQYVDVKFVNGTCDLYEHTSWTFWGGGGTSHYGYCTFYGYVERVRYETVYPTRYLGAWMDYDPGPGFAPGSANLGTQDKPGAVVTSYTATGLMGIHTLYVRVSAPCGKLWEISAQVQVTDKIGRPLKTMNLGTVTATCGLATFQFRFP